MRLFFAYPLNEEERLYFSEQSLKYQKYFSGKWVDKKNYHITVKFLGEVDKVRVQNIVDIVDDNVNKFKPAGITIDRHGFFGRPEPKVLWFGSSFIIAEVMDNFTLLQNLMQRFNFKKENHYIPHITVCRIKSFKTEHELVKKVLFKPLKIGIKSIVLYKSTLTEAGSIYTKIKEWKI